MILTQLEQDEAKDALTKLEQSKTVGQILAVAADAADFGGSMMIKMDKKREKMIMQEHLGNTH